MAKVKTTVRFDILNLVDSVFGGSFNDRLGNKVVAEAKELIASGQSPVRGYGRFQAYSDSYKKAIKGKSVDNPNKTVRPVNLNLSGEMMRNYKHKASEKSVFVGVYGGEHADIAQYHQDGTDKMPQRKIVPGDGEEFAVSIMRVIKEAYGKSLTDLIRRSNLKK